MNPMRIPSIFSAIVFTACLQALPAEEPDTKSAQRLHIVGIGAHPDDVAVGAGGVIASYVKHGHRATILNVTFGETVRPPGPQQEEAKRIRRKEGEDIARKLGADVRFLGWPGNTITPSPEMKTLLVNTLRELKADVVLFTTPWDTHPDHRNLSAAMKDVIYYVGHSGLAYNAPPYPLRSAWMYSIEADTEELHQPDLLFDVSDVFQSKLDSLTGTRPIFSWADTALDDLKIINGFWGLRAHVKQAEPLYQSWGSMKMAELTRDHIRVKELPLAPASPKPAPPSAPEEKKSPAPPAAKTEPTKAPRQQ
jgi:LmbE family N-acetylglucosaminyl deacetylase